MALLPDLTFSFEDPWPGGYADTSHYVGYTPPPNPVLSHSFNQTFARVQSPAINGTYSCKFTGWSDGYDYDSSTLLRSQLIQKILYTGGVSYSGTTTPPPDGWNADRETEGSSGWYGFALYFPTGSPLFQHEMIGWAPYHVSHPSYNTICLRTLGSDRLSMIISTGHKPGPGSPAFDPTPPNGHFEEVPLLGTNGVRDFTKETWQLFMWYVEWKATTDGVLDLYQREQSESSWTKLYSNRNDGSALINRAPHPTLPWNDTYGAPGDVTAGVFPAGCPGMTMITQIYRNAPANTFSIYFDGLVRRQSQAAVEAEYESPTALAVDAVSSSTTGGGTSATWSHTCTGSNLLLTVGISLRTAVNVTGVTYNGVALTQLVDLDTADNARVDIWYLIAPATGAHNVVVSLSGSSRGVCGAISFTGAHQVSPFGTPVTGTTGNGGSAAEPSLAVSSAAGEIVLDVVSYQWASGRTMTVGAGQTQRWNATDQSGSGVIGGCSTEPGAATVTMSWDLSSSFHIWQQAAVAVKAAAAAVTISATAATISTAGSIPSPLLTGPATLATISGAASIPTPLLVGPAVLATLDAAALVPARTALSTTIAAFPATVDVTALASVPQALVPVTLATVDVASSTPLPLIAIPVVVATASSEALAPARTASSTIAATLATLDTGASTPLPTLTLPAILATTDIASASPVPAILVPGVAATVDIAGHAPTPILLIPVGVAIATIAIAMQAPAVYTWSDSGTAAWTYGGAAIWTYGETPTWIYRA